ncbi:MAG: nucleoid-associated protein YgaU [Candidatus Aldehydirespiratoraceae bacterium]|jgi:nucleoid-associated protein YgaU
MKTSLTTRQPSETVSVRGAARLGTIALTAGAILFVMPITAGPSQVGELFEWWEQVGTPQATVLLLRAGALLLAIWLFVVSLLGAAGAACRSATTARLAWRLTPRSMRRLIAVSVALSVATPALANAAESTESPAPILVDLGPTDGSTEEDAEPPQLIDLGPLVASPRPSHLDASHPTPTVPQTWQVAPGDHLWGIAEETLTERGASPSEPEVEQYWRRLIDANRDAIGPNPDLIHPGVLLSLPTTPQVE